MGGIEDEMEMCCREAWRLEVLNGLNLRRSGWKGERSDVGGWSIRRVRSVRIVKSTNGTCD